jgi:alkylation response protein AidB-like acyl-CoA dehydrogenase
VVGLADTVARPNPDGSWRISGKKTWATLAEAADLLSFNAVVVDDDGLLPDDPMTRAMSELAFVLPMDTPGISIERTWDAMGMRGTGTQTVVFDEANAPAEANAGPFRNGLFNEFEWAALSFSGVYLGAMEKAYEFTRGVLRTKSMGATMEGNDVALKNLGYVQGALGEMYVLCRQSAYVVQQMCEDFITDDMSEFSGSLPQRLGNLEIGKLTTTENAIKVVDLGMRAIGGSAYRRGHLLERLYRDMRSGPFHVLTTNQIIDQLGRFELGLFDPPVAAA